jgi:lipopolysaccharide export system protein LptA
MIAAVFAVAAAAVPTVTHGATAVDSQRPDEQIRVSADRLVTDRTARTAKFTGRVKVVRGNSTIETDSLTVVYSEKSSGVNGALPVRSAIERIIAEGNVRIQSEDLTARTPKAIYSRPTQTVELIGGDSRVISGNNSITGERIVLHLEGERLTVSGDGDKRIKAVLEPTSKK